MSEPRNRVVQVRCFGDPDVIEIVDAPLPTAGAGEVRVRVLASSVEYTDVTIRRHVYAQTAALRPPFVLGYDVVGEIDQFGDGVSGFQLGDRVADMTVVGSSSRADRRADVLCDWETSSDQGGIACIVEIVCAIRGTRMTAL
jgi:NADPH:quinone reductase